MTTQRSYDVPTYAQSLTMPEGFKPLNLSPYRDRVAKHIAAVHGSLLPTWHTDGHLEDDSVRNIVRIPEDSTGRSSMLMQGVRLTQDGFVYSATHTYGMRARDMQEGIGWLPIAKDLSPVPASVHLSLEDTSITLTSDAVGRVLTANSEERELQERMLGIMEGATSIGKYDPAVSPVADLNEILKNPYALEALPYLGELALKNQ